VNNVAASKHADALSFGVSLPAKVNILAKERKPLIKPPARSQPCAITEHDAARDRWNIYCPVIRCTGEIRASKHEKA
jgi:hypothetical protein